MALAQDIMESKKKLKFIIERGDFLPEKHYKPDVEEPFATLRVPKPGHSPHTGTVYRLKMDKISDGRWLGRGQIPDKVTFVKFDIINIEGEGPNLIFTNTDKIIKRTGDGQEYLVLNAPCQPIKSELKISVESKQSTPFDPIVEEDEPVEPTRKSVGQTRRGSFLKRWRRAIRNRLSLRSRRRH